MKYTEGLSSICLEFTMLGCITEIPKKRGTVL